MFTGRFLPKMTPKDNANAHQQVFDGMHKNVDLALHVAKIRSLTPEIGVVHIEGYKRAKGKPDERQGEMMITAVVQKFPTRLENRRLPRILCSSLARNRRSRTHHDGERRALDREQDRSKCWC